MVNSKYLPIGSTIGKHYEIIDILGEDDFEILYLVRNSKQKESFFVIKELFLETFSSRGENNVVSTTSEAQGVFDKRKQEVINDIDNPKKNRKTDEIQTFGYIEENHTIYTVMEYTNNSDAGNYLQFEPKDQIILPTLEEIDSFTVIEKKSSGLLKLLIIPVLLALGLFGYKMYQERNVETKKLSTQTLSVQNTEPKASTTTTTTMTTDKQSIEVEEKSEDIKNDISNELNESLEIMTTNIKKLDNNKSMTTFVANGKASSDLQFLKETDLEIVKEIEKKRSEVKKVETKKVEVKKPEVKKETDFTQTSVKKFLNSFITSSAKSSSEKILSHYDTPVKKYFNLKNPSHAKIKKEILKYNKKWKNREFKIANFKIVRTYKKGNTEYCDLRTRTNWTVSNKGSKKISGKSRGFMTLKKVNNKFKISSIYTIK